MLYKCDKIDQNHVGQFDHLRTIFKNRGNFIQNLLTNIDQYATFDITAYEMICSITHISFCYKYDSNC